MKVIKSDRRYKYFNRGYAHIIQFNWAQRTDTNSYIQIAQALKELYGENLIQYTDEHGWPRTKRNENYVLEANASAKRRRIYVKNESDITLILLRG